MDKDLSPFGGEDREANRKTGRDSLVTVTLFRRHNKTFFFRVSLRSDLNKKVISRYELDVDQYSSEAEFLSAIQIAGGALAEHQNVTYGDVHDPDECAKSARESAVEILHDDKIKSA